MKHDGTYLLEEWNRIKRDGFNKVDEIKFLGLTIGRSNPSMLTALLSPPIFPEKLCKKSSLSGLKVDERCR